MNSNDSFIGLPPGLGFTRGSGSGMDLISKVNDGSVNLTNQKYDCRFMFQSGRTNEPEFARCDLATLQAEDAQQKYDEQLRQALSCQDTFQRTGSENQDCAFDWRSMISNDTSDYINFADTKISKKTIAIMGGIAASAGLLIFFLAKSKKKG